MIASASIAYIFLQASQCLKQQLVQRVIVQAFERAPLSCHVGSAHIREDFLEQAERCRHLRVTLVKLLASYMILQAIY